MDILNRFQNIKNNMNKLKTYQEILIFRIKSESLITEVLI